ncbi:MAG: tetratricopeptide repeat protein [Pirellulales bacterium]|nr:tetratricopeptide repeat protein [Pirellulales bacterium]
MPDAPEIAAPAEPTPAKPSLRARAGDAAAKFVAWSRASRRNMIVAASGGVTLIAVSLAAWSYLVRLAVDAGSQATVEALLTAYDANQFEDARQIAGRLQQYAEADKFGTALFVMGALKADEADDEFSPERRRAMHAVAARYLQKARSLGIPADREAKLQYLLGRSLIMGHQSTAGIDLLESAIQSPDMPRTEIHSLLATAYLDRSDPDLQRALAHLQHMLDDAALAPELRGDTVFRLTNVLLRLNRPDPARHALGLAGDQPERKAERELLSGRIRLVEAESLAADAPQRGPLLDEADARLREALEADPGGTAVSRETMYWLGRCYAARGQAAEALAQYQRLGKLYGDTAEGLAAMLGAAETYRDKRDFEHALASYQSLLELAPPPSAFVNPLITLADLRKRLLAAQQDFVDVGRYEDAVAMLDMFRDLFSRTEIVELQAVTEARWGAALLAPRAAGDRWRIADDQREGRRHYRIAGRAFEDLARLRFSQREFPDDLWQAAENYFAGQSYTSAARVYQEYLQHESRSRNALALLRLGQSHIAVSQHSLAVEALDECIVTYPRSDAVFQARLESARAHRELGKYDEAERLLWTNLTGDNLMPTSPEWRDSKFELGRLYYQTARYDDAIREIEEAVLRYPEHSETLLANYTIARSNHRASEAPARRMREAKTENERQKNRVAMNDYLERALATYGDVQRSITLAGGGDHDPLLKMLLRNCYMMRGAVLFDLRRFDEAREAYSGLSSLYQNDPFVLEIQVQIASCLRRLDEPVKARLAIVQAQQLLAALPADANFLASTNFSRQQWELLLDQMTGW